VRRHRRRKGGQRAQKEDREINPVLVFSLPLLGRIGRAHDPQRASRVLLTDMADVLARSPEVVVTKSPNPSEVIGSTRVGIVTSTRECDWRNVTS